MELKGRICAVVGDLNIPIADLKKEVYVLDNINKYTEKKKIIEALRMVNLDEEYLLKKSNDLSNVEYNKLLLVNDLVNKNKLIYLDFFEKGLCYKEKQYFKRLIKKLAKDYGISFLVITNDLGFCIDLVDEYAIYESNKETRVIDKKDLYKEEIYRYYPKHELVDFVIKSRKHGYLLDDYTDVKDVLKAIYRELK